MTAQSRAFTLAYEVHKTIVRMSSFRLSRVNLVDQKGFKARAVKHFVANEACKCKIDSTDTLTDLIYEYNTIIKVYIFRFVCLLSEFQSY